LSEVEHVANLGVEFRLNTDVVAGRAENLGPVNHVGIGLLKEWHDAVFLGVGLGETNKLNIAGEELDGVIDALAFIEQVKTRDWKSVPLGKTVIVIGAGNTAVDAVTQAKRLGATRVIMVYRRTESDAPAYDYEMELARKDGIEFMWQTTPVEIVGDKHVTGLRCKLADGAEIQVACDQIIKATGQKKMSSFFTDVCGVDVDEKGRVVVSDSAQTSDPKIFAGGDCVNGGAEAVDASQMGKLAAMSIHAELTGEKIMFAGADVS
jgi:glutamate synthase (NADPH/NADH) small chain